MTWEEALEIVVARTGHEPYRTACADSHPGHEAWRARMVEKATGLPPVPAYPSLATQATNLAGDLWAWAVSGFAMAPEAERSRRLAICEVCEYFDAGPRRCRHPACGCYMEEAVKLRTKQCPIGKW